MIVFDLKCGLGHVFEAWFGSTEDYDAQRKRGLVSCPICDDTQVEKALMAPAINVGGNREAAPDPAEQKAMLAKLAEMQRKIEAECDDVGDRFAQEARRLHAAPERENKRGIIGNASAVDVRELVEEGIPVMPLPFRSRRNNDA